MILPKHYACLAFHIFHEHVYFNFFMHYSDDSIIHYQYHIYRAVPIVASYHFQVIERQYDNNFDQ